MNCKATTNKGVKMGCVDFSILKGKIIKNIERKRDSISQCFVCDDDSVIQFTLNDGKKYLMLHFKDCCEEVYIEDICGDLNDLIGSPILVADAVTSDVEDDATSMWTFYKLSTIRGSVTIRWLGSTSSCYSIGVDFYELEGNNG